MPEEHDAQRPPSIGHRMAIDHAATSAFPGLPGFLARPSDAPVYHGFEVLHGVVVDGFTFGMFTDFEAEPTGYGDAFVIAPDNSRAGLVWEVSEAHIFEEVCADTEDRWGVLAVTFPLPVTSRDNVAVNLASIVPQLKARWETWKTRIGTAEKD